MVKTQTNRARGELLSVVLVTGCIYMWAAVFVCMTDFMGNKYIVFMRFIYTKM